jgi:hypothetical protein
LPGDGQPQYKENLPVNKQDNGSIKDEEFTPQIHVFARLTLRYYTRDATMCQTDLKNAALSHLK